MSTKKTFLVLDGNALLHRAWHALPPLTTKDGIVVNAAYGFAMILEKMIAEYRPDYMTVAWDLPGGTFRDELYEAYKAGREEKEQELYDQIPIIQEILEAFGIPSVEAEGFEADDIIGTLSLRAKKKGYKTLIVTGDLDALQLVEEDVHVVFFVKGISQTKVYDPRAVADRYGLTSDQLIDYKALRGDASDNIPGLKGVGDKTATMLLQEHGSVEGIYDHLDSIAEKYAKKFRGFEEDVELSKKLVTIVRDVRTGFRFFSAKVGPPDYEVLIPLYRDLEFRTLLRKHGERVEEEKSTKAAVGVDVSIHRGEVDVEIDCRGRVGVVIAEQAEDLFGATMAALAVSDGQEAQVFVNPSEKTIADVMDALGEAKVVTHNLKRLMHQVKRRLRGEVFDTMIASYLLHAGSRSHDLASVVHKQLGQKVQEMPAKFSADADYKRLGRVVATLPALAEAMESALKDDEQMEVLETIEMPLIGVLHDMEVAGIELDVASLKVFSKKLSKKIDALIKKVTDLAGKEFNLNSPAQLSEILFEDLALPTKGIKKTKTNYSTAASELEKLWDAHEIVPLVAEYRELAKLKSTYVEALPKLVGEDGRLHTTYNQAVAATGRLSSSEPNLQNIPIRTELGREIRKAFVAPRGRRLVAADYSQIEIRLMAVLSKDKAFTQAFLDGADIHTRTAAEVWEVDEAEVSKEQRYAAKAINFGIMYGMGPRSLARSTGLSYSEAREFIDKYFALHPAVRAYIDETKALAHTQGYVETLFGRRRTVPEIESGVPMLVAQGERMAVNHPLQGTASDVMKMAMLAVDGWLNGSEIDAQVLLQVHDELVVECGKDAVDAVVAGLRREMRGVASFDVPLVVDVEVGKNWGEMEDV